MYDVAIVGGGAMGSSSAYFLANRMARGIGKICVIERDPTVRCAVVSLQNRFATSRYKAFRYKSKSIRYKCHKC